MLKQPTAGNDLGYVIDDIHRAPVMSSMRGNCSWCCVIFSTNILKRAPAWRHYGGAANLATMVIAPFWFSYSSF